MYPHISRVLAEQHTRDLQNEATWAHRARLARTRPIRRFIHTGALLTIIGLRRLARAARSRWRPLLAGGVLTMVGLMLRSGAWGALILPGIWFLGSALLVPANPDADRKRSELEREQAINAPSAQLCSWIYSAFDARP
jgi:hypothetical protein